MRYFTVGIVKKHMVVNATTHGCEIITTSLTLELMNKIAMQNSLFEDLLNKVTIHFIPLMNPEGFIISTSAVDFVLKNKTERVKFNIMVECLQNARQYDVNVNNKSDLENEPT